jgi:hypothetical protein
MCDVSQVSQICAAQDATVERIETTVYNSVPLSTVLTLAFVECFSMLIVSSGLGQKP